MAAKHSGPTQNKRLRERQKKEKQQAKVEKKALRKETKVSTPGDDIATIEEIVVIPASYYGE